MERQMTVSDVKIHVSRVQVAGLKRTKNDIVVQQIKDVLKVESLRELLIQSVAAVGKLQELDVFKHVAIRLDTDKKNHSNDGAEAAKKKSVEVTFVVREKGWFNSGIGGSVGTQSGDANFSLTLRNILGRAEQLKLVSGTSLPHWGHTVQLEFSKPYYKDLEKKLHFSLGTMDMKLPFSGYQEHVTGTNVDIRLPSVLESTVHTIGVGFNWRQVYGLSPNVPLSIRQEAGHSIKSSIKHVMEVDRRDNPNIGYYVKVSHELAGLSDGGVAFTKGELQSEIYKTLFNSWLLSFTMWGGLMYHPNSQSKINDRFLLGGPTTLRGFGMWGAGPRQQGYSLGGDAYWASGLHLFSPLPFVKNEVLRRIRIHSFATAGNLVQCSGLSRLGALTSGVRLSCGVGFHVFLGRAQLELNYAIPIKAQPLDHVEPGFQFGVGLNLL